MNTYLLIYANNLGSREKLVKVLNSIPEVKRWRYDMPNCFYIHSELEAKPLVDAIRTQCGGQGRCLMLEIEKYSGWLPKDTWDFIKKYQGDKE